MRINLIKRALKLRGKDIKWLSKKMRCNYSHLCLKIKANNLTLQEIDNILLHLDLYLMPVLTDKDRNIV